MIKITAYLNIIWFETLIIKVAFLSRKMLLYVEIVEGLVIY